MPYLPYSDQVLIRSQGAKIGSTAIVSIGTSASTGNPPVPLASIYSDGAGTPTANPFFTDIDGNLTFFAEPGVYIIAIQFGTALYQYPVTVGEGA